MQYNGNYPFAPFMTEKELNPRILFEQSGQPHEHNEEIHEPELENCEKRSVGN